jgi:outer membrane protein assembly complex protein YaeT
MMRFAVAGEMILTRSPVVRRSIQCSLGVLLTVGLALWVFAPKSNAQTRARIVHRIEASRGGSPAADIAGDAEAGDPASKLAGLQVIRISFEGVPAARLAPLPDHLAQTTGAPLSEAKLAASLRQLYATGLYESVEATGTRSGDGVAVTFRGKPALFIGRVSVEGAKGATLNTQLEYASRLAAGTRFTPARLTEGLAQMRAMLADNGFHEPVITDALTEHPEDQLVDIAFHVVPGPQAHVGDVQITGDAGMSADEFRRLARLRQGARVDHDTTNRALTGVLKHYQKGNHLEAEIKLTSQTYAPSSDTSNFSFSASRGPVVRVQLEGASIDPERLKHAVPVYEEGTVDEDLLNEGNRRLRDYFQRQGYFDVKVTHRRLTPQANEVEIVFQVELGARRRVERVGVSGNHYFDSATLKDLLSVRAADYLDRHGSYSQALVSADVNALQSVYRNNGFSQVAISPTVSEIPSRRGAASHKPSGLSIVYNIVEGVQQRVGSVNLTGNDHVETKSLLELMNTVPGQLLSPQSLAGDRDALLTDYLTRGFEQADVTVSQQQDLSDGSRVDVTFHIQEGQQVFVRNVLLTGLHFTRPSTVARAITLHPGDPLNQSAMAQTQSNLYDFALFNEVRMATQNPRGNEQFKTILVQTSEARRWALTYGFGFETQTGQPQNNCAGFKVTGTPCNPNGKTGISPRVLGSVTRNNLFGREQSASIQGTYGLLEQEINLVYQNPHFHGNRNIGLTFTGGYANSQDVTTYVASKLDAGLRVTENFNAPNAGISRANTFIYEFDFRRVKVASDSLQVYPAAIPQLAAAVRVGGPGFTWIRDTRDSPLDAHRGTYLSFQEFVSNHAFGAEAQFNRLDVSHSSYFGLDHGRIVLARNTRYAQERAYGPASDELIPLPERIYAGGPISLRGFSVNAAGPRDPETGFPIGGAGALMNSTELRLPPPNLPLLGNSLSFVVFHDMGNVFTNAGDAWASILRVSQPNRDACKVLNTSANTANLNNPIPSGPSTSTGIQGRCSFDYFSHEPGLGLRYHTPVGPIRLDFSYNLNPPIFPVNIDYSLARPASQPRVGEARHFNFIFSLGQTF